MNAHFFFLALGLALPGVMAQTQSGSPPPQKLSCSTFPLDKSFGKIKLWDGYEVSVEPTEQFGQDALADGCTAAIYDQSGKEVYRTTGPGVMLDPATGLDIDGDGSPDVVLMNGSSGGSGGSWEVEVVSLKPQPHLLLKLDEEFPPSGFDKDSQGRVVLWSGWGGNSGLGYSMAHAYDPSARIVYRFTDGKLKDMTPEYCGDIERGKYFPRVKAADLEQFKNSKITSGEFESLDDQSTAGKVMSLVLHYVFCRQFDKALDVIHQSWPVANQAELIKNLKGELSHVEVCPDCAKEMEKWH